MKKFKILIFTLLFVSISVAQSNPNAEYWITYQYTPKKGMTTKFESAVKAKTKMYNNKNVLTKNNKGKSIVKKLFNKIAKNPRKFLNKEQLKFDKHRAIADFISGMTDRYAINLYKKI